ncbi:putative AMP binding protein [Cutaneotrichosporon oleaginosum]|uniref:Putative AMP binding protein n=1 Tax=Cutaneotrichosporon oleaginosum TaxID=879819 RepID=A0A0J0XQV1_9TREE|nr:putative AMP binding protein [Cutaneotrichosporon oleaginosum]KLT43481.1 putative AMP binding protein [Cutaneotrichosporon oleaginosum]
MPLTIYESELPAPYLPQISIFDYILPGLQGVSPLQEFDPSLPAFIDGRDGTTLTRAGLRDLALRLAGGLRALGIRRGDVAGVWGYNSLEWVNAAYGCLAAGVVVSPANYAYAPAEVAHQLNDSGSSAVFVDPELLPNFEKAREHLSRPLPPSRVILLCRPEHKPANSPYKCLAEILADPVEPEHFDGVASNETAWMSYSSGTTGLPKGVMTTHFNFTSQLQANNCSYHLDCGPNGDVVLGFLPMSHIYGLTISLLQPLTFGAPVVVLPRFDEIPVLEAIQKYKVTHGLLVPPLILRFLHSPNTAKYDISSMRTIMSGGAPLSPELAAAFEKKFPGCVSIQGYGMTETTPGITAMKRADVLAGGRQGWVGRLLPTYQARLVLPDGTDAARGAPGELWVRGPSVMKGYHNNAAATAETMALGGWFRTGDVLVRDEHGWYKVVDRVKELIKYKGFQVAPAELEALLLTHPRLVDAGVVGVYDAAEVTEMPRAYVVAAESVGKGEYEALVKDVQAWVAARVAQHKKLRGGVVVVDAIPKSPSGKILRKDLRKRAQAEYESKAAARL